MQIINEYETVLILRPTLDDAVLYGAVEKLEGVIGASGGQLLDRDDWGKRKLAYPIQKQAKGHYVLLKYLSDPALVSELERNIRILDEVIRFLTVKLGDEVDPEARKVAAAAARADREARRAAERARAEAERDLDDEMDDEDEEQDD